MRPLIGITSFPRSVDLLGLDQPNDTVPRSYVSSIRRAGGAPILLPVIDPDEIEPLLAPLDGLVLTGGGDVDPGTYGAAGTSAVDRIDPSRDAFDLAVVERVLAAELPVLAICRGLQVLNVAFGGTLHPDLPEHRDLARPKGTAHSVSIDPRSRLGRIVRSDRMEVNSLHHQAVDVIGDGLRVTARSLEDEIVEGLELEDGRPFHGVQWHPELLRDRPAHLALFEDLVAEAT